MPTALRRLVPLLLTATAAVVATAAAVPAAAPASAAPTWTTVWSDEFSGTGRLSPAWLYRLGTAVPGGPAQFGTGELETNTDSTANVFQANGSLHIKAIRSGSGAWTSGRVESVREDLRPPAGGLLAVQARMQLPNLTGPAAQGYWPAFWLLGTPYRSNPWSWPAIGELDVMENVQGLNTVWGTTHCDVAPGGECHEFDGIGASTTGGTPSLQSAMHTYRLEWDESVTPNEMRWYVDGRLYHRVDRSMFSAATWSAAFGHPFYVILNLAIGGAFPAAKGGGPYPTTASGGELVVDHVRVLSAPGSGTTTPPTPTTGPTTSATSTIQAESFSASSAVTVTPTTDTGGGSAVAGLGTGDVLRFDRVDLGGTPLHQFTARAASGAAPGVSGLVEVRVDSPTGPVLGSFAIASTGGWQSWRTVPANVTMPTGVHTLYVTTTSGQPADFVALNWLTFS